MIRIVKLFKYEGITGTLDNHGFVCWGGMGFELSAAIPKFRAAVEAA